MYKKNNIKIQYLTHYVDKENSAEAVNVRRRSEVLENLGFHVTKISEQQSVISTFIALLRSSKNCSFVIIRIDGTCSLDKYSIIKFVFPRVKIIWEIHGYPEESSEQSLLLKPKHSVMRKLFSFFSDAHIFMSDTLKTYSRRKVVTRPSMTIENFVTRTDIALSEKIKKYSRTTINKNQWFSVFWGGNPNYPWHATGQLEPVAKVVYKLDPQILFITVGRNNSLPKWNKNIIRLSPMNRETYLSMINQVDICVALYQTPSYIPVYFSPMKLLDYLLFNKPFIVSNITSIRDYIKNKPAGVLTDNSISDLVRNIMAIKKNPSLGRMMIQNGKVLLNHEYSEKTAFRKYKQFFTLIHGIDAPFSTSNIAQ